MLANGIKQTTSTTGTGNLTLTAVAGYPKLSDAFAIGAMLSYTLLDSNGLFLESGIGYLSDAVTLVRAKVSATYNGSAYSTSAPTAASLTGTTTVIDTPHAATLESMMPTVDKVSTGVLRYLTSAGRNAVTTSTGPSAMRVYYVPFLLRTATPIASLAISVSTAGAAATVARAGIYACNENGYPGALLATTSDLDTASTGMKVGTLSAPLALAPGWYFTAVVCSGTPSILAYTSNVSNVIGGNPFGFNTTPVAMDFRIEVVAGAVLPAAASTSTSASNVGAQHTPLVFLGAA